MCIAVSTITAVILLLKKKCDCVVIWWLMALDSFDTLFFFFQKRRITAYLCTDLKLQEGNMLFFSEPHLTTNPPRIPAYSKTGNNRNV